MNFVGGRPHLVYHGRKNTTINLARSFKFLQKIPRSLHETKENETDPVRTLMRSFLICRTRAVLTWLPRSCELTVPREPPSFRSTSATRRSPRAEKSRPVCASPAATASHGNPDTLDTDSFDNAHTSKTSHKAF